MRQRSGEIPRLRREGRLWDPRLWRPCRAPERPLRISDRGTREAGAVISGTVVLGAEPKTLGKNGAATFTGPREWTVRPPLRSL